MGHVYGGGFTNMTKLITRTFRKRAVSKVRASETSVSVCNAEDGRAHALQAAEGVAPTPPPRDDTDHDVRVGATGEAWIAGSEAFRAVSLLDAADASVAQVCNARPASRKQCAGRRREAAPGSGLTNVLGRDGTCD